MSHPGRSGIAQWLPWPISYHPNYSNDPCDCLIGATALAEGIPLVTKDRTIRKSRAITTIW